MIDLINIKSKCQLFFYNNALYMALSVLKKSTITFFKNCDCIYFTNSVHINF